MSITNGIKLIHLVESIDQDSNKYREHNFSGSSDPFSGLS